MQDEMRISHYNDRKYEILLYVKNGMNKNILFLLTEFISLLYYKTNVLYKMHYDILKNC